MGKMSENAESKKIAESRHLIYPRLLHSMWSVEQSMDSRDSPRSLMMLDHGRRRNPKTRAGYSEVQNILHGDEHFSFGKRFAGNENNRQWPGYFTQIKKEKE